MNLDHFLDFWSQYNQTIIQALIVVTLIFIVALVFITLFGSKNDEAAGAQVGLSPDLEKSLQKMLENQTKAAVFDFSKAQDNAAPSSIATQPAAAASPEAVVQLEKLKAEVDLKEKKIQELNTQLSQAVNQSTKELKIDSSANDARIKELEARLAEYDIISEDIADLSRYKDENERIKAELAALKGGAAAAAEPSAPPPQAAAPTPPSQPVAEPAPEPVPAAAEASPETPAVQQPAEAVAETATAAPELKVVSAEAAPTDAPAVAPISEESPAPAPEADPAISAAIDDDLMKEFAAAVEGQKAAATQNANIPAPNSDNEDLMGQFENFVQKKEGS